MMEMCLADRGACACTPVFLCSDEIVSCGGRAVCVMCCMLRACLWWLVVQWVPVSDRDRAQLGLAVGLGRGAA